MKEKTRKLRSLEGKVKNFQKEHQQEINNLQNQIQESENILRRRFEERINNLQTEINEKVDRNKVKKEINIARTVFLCFIAIFVGVVSVFSYQIYKVQPQQINNVQQIFEQKVRVLQSQFEEEVKKDWKNCELEMGVVESQSETKLGEVRTFLDGSFSFTWKITGVEDILSRTKKGYQTSIESDPFYMFGYKLKLSMNPDGYGDRAGTHISLYIALMKGANDAIIPWPFHKRLTFTLIDQQESLNYRENRVMAYTTSPEFEDLFGRPMTDQNPGSPLDNFVSHDKLRERRYIVNDTILIQLLVSSPLKD